MNYKLLQDSIHIDCRNFQKREGSHKVGYTLWFLSSISHTFCRKPNHVQYRPWKLLQLPEPWIRLTQPRNIKSHVQFGTLYCLIISLICLGIKIILTGVRRAGVEIGDPSWELNLIPDPRSKSHNFTGHNWSSNTQSTFSGFKSRWAIPVIN